MDGVYGPGCRKFVETHIIVSLIGRRGCAICTVLKHRMVLDILLGAQICRSSCDAHVLCDAYTTSREFVDIHHVIAIPIGPYKFV